tara:strand:+ start:415 stop:984 length:570 start_codon:yes stop_codon:yes gene_type:complete
MKKLFFTLSALLASFNSFAHPHVWVHTDLTLLTDNSTIKGLKVHWAFDEMYSTAFMMDADMNGDGELDAAERKIMEKQVMQQAVSRLRPFVMLKLNGFDVRDFSFDDLKITYDKEAEKVNYDFVVKLKKAQKLNGSHKLAILDKEYYVGFEQSYNFGIPSNCSFELEEDMDILLYDGLINPETYKLTCK